MKILAGSSCKNIAQKIAHQTKLQYVDVSIRKFNNRELKVQIKQNLSSEEIIIISSMARYPNNQLMELLLIADAAINAGARKIISLVIYFGYARQDRILHNYAPLSARLVSRLIETAGITKIITFDLHSKLIADFFKIDHLNITPLSLFIDDIKEIPNIVIVSPDLGGVSRAKEYSDKLNLNLAIISNSRC